MANRGLVNLRTDLKSLKFGKDIVGGGNSAQPYVIKDIPSSFQDVGRTGGPDFLLRGGTLFPRAVINDVSRMTQMLFDFRSPNGPLYIAKQNVLSLSNVNTNTGYIPWIEPDSDGGGGNPTTAIGQFIADNLAMNQGVFTPLSTLASVVGTGVGIHPNKQGLNPFNPMLGAAPDDVQTDPKGITLPTYIRITKGDTSPDNNRGVKSRLLGFLPKILNKTSDNNLYSYVGGPGATLGVGKTNIDMLNDQRTGINQMSNTGQLTGSFASMFPMSTLAKAAQSFNNIKSNPALFALNNILPNISGSFRNPSLTSVYATGSAGPLSPNNLILSGSLSGISTGFAAFNQQQIEDYYEPGGATGSFARTSTGFKPNFEEKLINDTKLIPKSPDYIEYNIEKRVNLGNPGQRGTGTQLRNYSWGKDAVNATDKLLDPLDKITGLPLYKSEGPIQNEIKNDLVKFRIGIIDNNNPSEKTYIHFRAFIDSLSDSYSADWMSQKFMGRAENFYKYQGFDRQVSLGWTVAAQSKQELIPMYQKLNYLASTLAPDYSNVGYMQGNLITLTMGGWFYEQPGLITGMSLDVPDDSPWDIALGPDGASDSTVKEMPMIIKVSGFNFIPIHNFVPRVQQNTFANSVHQGAEANYINSYGKERYLALNNGDNNNYSSGKGYNYIPQKPTDT